MSGEPRTYAELEASAMHHGYACREYPQMKGFPVRVWAVHPFRAIMFWMSGGKWIVSGGRHGALARGVGWSSALAYLNEKGADDGE
jgi:hypothetical protein